MILILVLLNLFICYLYERKFIEESGLHTLVKLLVVFKLADDLLPAVHLLYYLFLLLQDLQAHFEYQFVALQEVEFQDFERILARQHVIEQSYEPGTSEQQGLYFELGQSLRQFWIVLPDQSWINKYLLSRQYIF